MGSSSWLTATCQCTFVAYTVVLYRMTRSAASRNGGLTWWLSCYGPFIASQQVQVKPKLTSLGGKAQWFSPRLPLWGHLHSSCCQFFLRFAAGILHLLCCFRHNQPVTLSPGTSEYACRCPCHFFFKREERGRRRSGQGLGRGKGMSRQTHWSLLTVHHGMQEGALPFAGSVGFGK